VINNYQRARVIGNLFLFKFEMKCTDIGSRKVNLKKLRAHSKLNRKDYLINNSYPESVNCNRIS